MSINDIYHDNMRECMRLADSSETEHDRTLWLAMAQSWLRLSEQAAARGLIRAAEQAHFEDSSS